jgi:transcriptional regulator with XRE-family HTH domain
MPIAVEVDIPALYDALDERRRSRGLSWPQVARELSEQFGSVPSRAISPSTLIGLRRRRTIEGDGALQMLRWLGRSPESFVRGHTGEPHPAELLPDAGPSRILRFDAQRIYAALDATRGSRGLTWRQVAAEIGVIQSGSLTRLAKGGRVGFPDIMRIAAWLERPAASLTRPSSR